MNDLEAPPWEIGQCKISVTKHFALDYMRHWGWDMHDLRMALQEAYKIEKIGKEKYEVYVQKSGYKKIITVYYEIEEEILCITGSQGGERK